MVRRYGEPIEVRAAADRQPVPQGTGTPRGCQPGEEHGDTHPSAADGPAPDAFIWRGRLYVVRALLGHWHERRPWWREALDPRGSAPRDLLSELEHEVWRVEAGPGRLHASGVYDLAREDRGWRLLRVAD